MLKWGRGRFYSNYIYSVRLDMSASLKTSKNRALTYQQQQISGNFLFARHAAIT